jgi:cobalt-zinc-cadmium efflux system protein
VSLEPQLRHARRLEWWTIGWMISVVIVMGLAMGSSQAMKTAWIEDMLSLIPAVVFLIALRFEAKPPDRRFPYGYDRVNNLAFIISAVALSLFGGFLLFESVMTLIKQEHVTIEPVTIFGRTFWSGWLMIAALAYSIVPPVILGMKKLPIAKQLDDEVLHTDAMMQKADWMTGLAGIVGVTGVGLGFWWADAAAAGIISFSILHDGAGALRTASAELVDAAPRKLGSSEIADDAEALREVLERRFPGSEVRLRETGRYIHAQVIGAAPPAAVDRDELWPCAPERAWRFAQLSFVPPDARTDAAGKSQGPSRHEDPDRPPT